MRGEIYIRNSDFVAFNKKQEEAGKEIAANPRNFAAGSLRQKDALVTASRPLKFFAYTWGEMSERPADTQHGMLEWMNRSGFVVNPLIKLCKSSDDLLEYHHKMVEERTLLDYDIDGVVYKVDSLKWQESIRREDENEFRRAPRWAHRA